MRVALVAVYNYMMNENREEIGICSISAFLREYGYEVLLMSGNEERINFSRIIDFKPELIGFSVYNISKDSVYRTAKRIRKELPGALICVGGCLPTYHAVEMMEESEFIDFAIRGEGEMVLLDLLRHLEGRKDLSAVKGLIFRDGRNIMVNERQDAIEDLDSLPIASRDLLVDNKMRYADIFTSRGCTRNCNFCCSPSYWYKDGPKWRGRDVRKVIDEIEHIVQNYGVRYFSFSDNSFEDPGINCKRVQEIAEAILKRNLNICYFINLRADFHRKASDELVKLLRQSGLFSIYVGIEASNDEDLKVYNKFATVEDNEKIVELFRRHDIHVDIGFINFNPYSTFVGLRKNIEYLEKYRFASCFTHVSRYRMYKGSSLYQRIKDEGLLKEGKYDDEYAYRYTDERLEKLANFLDKYIFTENAQSAKFYFYSHDFLILTSFYRRLFSTPGHQKAYEIILKHESKLKQILSEINSRNVKSFRELLDLAESGWDEKLAYETMRRFMNSEYIGKTVFNLDTLKFTLLSDLGNLGPAYSRYLVMN
jgi:anaerobic magnesium-protoporphyrin IX monomethyl ester cyclase